MNTVRLWLPCECESKLIEAKLWSASVTEIISESQGAARSVMLCMCMLRLLFSLRFFVHQVSHLAVHIHTNFNLLNKFGAFQLLFSFSFRILRWDYSHSHGAFSTRYFYVCVFERVCWKSDQKKADVHLRMSRDGRQEFTISWRESLQSPQFRPKRHSHKLKWKFIRELSTIRRQNKCEKRKARRAQRWPSPPSPYRNHKIW